MNKHPNFSPATERGVALIEIMVAVLLVTFGLLGLISLLGRSAQFAVGAEDSQRASLLAGEMSSAMWSANRVNLDAAVVSAWATRVADASKTGLPNGVGVVSVAGNVARITVTWRAPRAAVGEENRYSTDVSIPVP